MSVSTKRMLAIGFGLFIVAAGYFVGLTAFGTTLGYPLIALGVLVCVLSLFFGEHVVTVVQTTVMYALGAPLVVFLFAGFMVGFNQASLIEAAKEDLGIALISSAVGAIIGFVVGIREAISGSK